MDTVITIEYSGFKWVATEKNDGETFLCKEYTSFREQPDAVYSLHEDKLEGKISQLLEGSV